MAKRCPMQNNRPVIYLDCAECEHKKECREKSKQKNNNPQITHSKVEDRL